MNTSERLLERIGPARPQLKHVWRGRAEHHDNLGEVPQNVPTTIVLDKAGALHKTVRGRVPAELWDDIAEFVLG